MAMSELLRILLFFDVARNSFDHHQSPRISHTQLIGRIRKTIVCPPCLPPVAPKNRLARLTSFVLFDSQG
jgi:hypothetical protein